MSIKKGYYSIIDIGSNSIRLVIYAQDHSPRLHEVENVKAMARLRNDLAGHLSYSLLQSGLYA